MSEIILPPYLPEIIFCAGGTPKYAEIAIAEGMLYGVQAPRYRAYAPVHFVDQDWRDAVLDDYAAAMAELQPAVATVLDLEHVDQLPEVLRWAETIAPHVSSIVIIPKASGVIDLLPRRIGGAMVRLGYSVPTRYGGTCVPIWEFQQWPVHLLGGSPQQQLLLSRYMFIASADCNMAMRQANTLCQYWVPGTARHARNRWWPQMQEMGDGTYGADACYEAFRRSCRNIMAAWRERYGLGDVANEAAS